MRNPHERGPWFLNENISIARSFGVDRMRVEFRFEVFNLLNRTIWAAPNSLITSANFGLVTERRTRRGRSSSACGSSSETCWLDSRRSAAAVSSAPRATRSGPFNPSL